MKTNKDISFDQAYRTLKKTGTQKRKSNSKKKETSSKKGFFGRLFG